MSESAPPRAARRPVVRECHGIRWTDEYAWLRDPGYPNVENQDILEYLEAENRHFEAWSQSREPLVTKLFDEFKGRIKDDDSSIPVRDGKFEYYWKFEPGAQYRCWFRRSHGNPSVEEILVDEPRLAEGHDYFNLRQIALANDADRLAIATDIDGSERYRITVTSLNTRQELTQTITNTSGAAVWDQFGNALYYVELNDSLRPFRVRRRCLTSPDAGDTIVFEEHDSGFFVSIGQTSDRSFLRIESGDHVTSEIRVLDLARPKASQCLIAKRRKGHRYSLDHANGSFFILTNDEHENYRLIRTSVDQPDENHWQQLIAGSDRNYLLGLRCFADFMVITQRVDGQCNLRVLHYSGSEHAIDFGAEVFATGLGDNREFATDRIRLSFSSPVTPPTVFDYDIAERRLITRKVKEIPSGYDQNQYRCERIWAASHDDVPVPITVVWHIDTPLNGTAPLVLYGYGSYGMGLDPGFNANRLSLMDRGIICATAHVRGGDELGHSWYERGKLQQKTNTFKDFIACAETLVDQGYTEPRRIAIMGGSAGGMLVGAALNIRPDLWGCAIAQVPFVDVLNTMLDASLPLTPIEWPEWGNPIENPADFAVIHSYSPYDNVREADYPPILATAGISDPRVTYWEPAKWVAKLRATKTSDKPLLLKTNMGSGHFGVSGRFAALRESAEIYAFIIDTLQFD